MNNTKPTFIMLAGLPCSGKSTLAQKIAKEYNMEIFSSDALREELFGDINEQSRDVELFAELHKRVKECLKDGKNAIYDACNRNYKNRKSFLSELKNISCKKVCIIMATPYEECIKRSKVRERKVPEHVIKRMYMNWNTPYWFEGWDEIYINHSSNQYKHVFDWIEEYIHYKQDNPHHTLTLGEHCLGVGTQLNYDNTLFAAGLLHDCGKPFTKSFINSKGEETNIAHYYQHHCVGAYDSLFYLYPDNVEALDVSILINLHMMPYNWEREGENFQKLYSKYEKLWGKELCSDVMKLHFADKESH